MIALDDVVPEPFKANEPGFICRIVLCFQFTILKWGSRLIFTCLFDLARPRANCLAFKTALDNGCDVGIVGPLSRQSQPIEDGRIIWSKGCNTSSSTGVVRPEDNGDSSVSVELR